MASIYKRKSDRARKRAPWYIGYTDHDGARRTVKGFTDRGETERLAARLEHEAMLRSRGLIDPAQEQLVERKRSAVAGHVKAFLESLSHNTPKHVRLITTRIERVISGCEFKTLNDLDAEDVERFLRKMAREEDLGNKTYNHYVQAIDEFGKWLVASKRLPHNPVASLTRLNTEVDVRHKRRALTADEVARMIASARGCSKPIQGYSGEERARLYAVSYLTGLRKNELSSLTPASFDFASEPPKVTVQAAFSKHRREDVLPVHPELLRMLREWMPALPADAPLFPRLAGKKTWLMVRKDLERVGIPYETAEGIADFHAAGRHTYITELLRNGATIPEARELARHSDVNMTMRYTHIGIDDQAKALSQLPWTPPKEPGGSGGEPDPSADGLQRNGSVSGVSPCHDGASGGSSEAQTVNGATPVGDGGCRHFSSPDSGCQEWRRRELHPRPETHR